MGYHRAGFDVVGVDINPQPNYPFHHIRADVLTYMKWSDPVAAGYDTIHASPPCQAYSTASQHHKGKHPELIEPVREWLDSTGLPYVIENVPGAPMIDPVRFCGSSFGLRVRRHRMFEATWDDCWMTREELAEAVPPAYTEFIGSQLLEHVWSNQSQPLSLVLSSP